MRIRPESPADAAAIRAVVEVAFRGVAHSRQTEAAIVDALRASGALSLSLVADQHGSVIGHAAVSPVRVDGADIDWFGLGPVAVRPDRQGAGVGSALIEAALDQLAARGARGCVVLGDPGYYGRFGFVSDPALRYPGVPAEYFQARVLRGPPARGDVAYPPAFAAD